MADVLFKNKKDLYIIEHKHMKEGGGGQNKQITEIINFISERESDKLKIHYVTFLDGIYFNLFIKSYNNVKTKIPKQIEHLEKSLQNNPNNYFVNTAGFIRLLKSI